MPGAEYSVVVKTRRRNKLTKFEPYRGYDKAKAETAFDHAADRLESGEVVLWELTLDDGKPIRSMTKA